MKLIVVELEGARGATDSPARALEDLGCDVRRVGPDLVVDPAALRPPPQALVIDARAALDEAYRCLPLLRGRPELGGTPALVVVALGRLTGLDFGAADDFVLYPIVPAELYARLRQLDWRLSAFTAGERIKLGDLVIDLAGYEAHLRDRRLHLTHQEFELLKFLARSPGKVFSRAQLLTKVWGYRAAISTRTVDIHVRRLRAALGPPGDRWIETVRNVGYKLSVPSA